MGGQFSLPEFLRGLSRSRNGERNIFNEIKEFERYLRNTPLEEAHQIKTLTFKGKANGQNCSEIPKDIGRFVHLTSLTLIHMNIEKVPWCVVFLKELTHLDLSYNSISEFPKYFFYLRDLEHLNLSYNKMEGLPKNVLNLKSLKTIDLRGNERTIVCPPYDVCAKGWEAIRNFLRQDSKRNLWRDSRVYYSKPGGGVRHFDNDGEVDSLFSIALSAVLRSEVDFLSPVYVAPRMKTFLTEKEEDRKRNSIQVAKCANCNKCFSNQYYFDGHVCGKGK